jgi:chromosome partitioning protein
MKILAIASSKGGSGKSTLARGLAVHAALDGRRVLLLDLDPQQTSGGWWLKNERANPVLGDLGKKRELSFLADLDFDLAILDTPPEHELSWRSTEAIKAADLVIIPVRPSPDDIDSVGLTVNAARSAKKQFAFVASQTTNRASLVGDLDSALSEHGPILGHLMSRQDIPRAHQFGKVAVDIKPTCPAAIEMRAVWWRVSEMLGFDDKKGAIKL